MQEGGKVFIIANHKIADILSKTINIEAIALPPYSKLDTPVNAHADMLVSVLEDKIFMYKDYYLKNREALNKIDKNKLTLTEHNCSKEYPGDVALNALIIGKKMFCNIKHIAKELLDYATICNYKIIDVKQGYSCCSTLAIDENHAITSDKGMYNALKKENVETLLIDNENITLDGYNCGFIGGSGGIISNKVLFFGDIRTLDDYAKIKDFIGNLNKDILTIFPGGVSDFGTFFV